jgi:hypothetical protein
MIDKATQLFRSRRLYLGIIARFGLVVVVAFLIGGFLKRTAVSLDQRHEPAGFMRGIVQGALMPCTLPALLLGHDVTIYCINNNGVTYKLGYTVGVNLCGAAFFGLLYRRINRWRRHLSP